MLKKWSGKVWIGDGLAYYLGRTGDSKIHRHCALQVTMAYDGVVSLFDENGQETIVSGAVIPANVPHRIQAHGEQKIAFIYMEPDSSHGRALMAQFPHDGSSLYLLSAETVSACLDELDLLEKNSQSKNFDTSGMVSILTCTSNEILPLDPRVQKTMAYIRNHLDELDSLEPLAEMLAISPRYLRRLFEQQAGMSIQRFRLWVKLRTALDRIAAGLNLTDAAHEAGFTDSAHFSRTFRAMFGIAPSDLLREI